MMTRQPHRLKRDTKQSRPRLIPARVRRLGEGLLHQQCWAWGRDVRREEGNLLLEFGFEKFRPPEDAQGSTAYRLELPASRSLTLWGFGFYYSSRGHGGGVFLGRFDFTPKLSTSVCLSLPLWQPQQLPAMSPARDGTERLKALRLLSEACKVIEAYERWVLATFGRDYRLRCLSEFRHAVFTPDETVAGWRSIRDACERGLLRLTPRTGL